MMDTLFHTWTSLDFQSTLWSPKCIVLLNGQCVDPSNSQKCIHRSQNKQRIKTINFDSVTKFIYQKWNEDVFVVDMQTNGSFGSVGVSITRIEND